MIIYVVSGICIVQSLMLIHLNIKKNVIESISKTLIKTNEQIITFTLDYLNEKELDKDDYVKYINRKAETFILQEGEEE